MHLVASNRIDEVPQSSRLKRLSTQLEIGVVALTLATLLYRMTLYWLLPAAAEQAYGTRDLIDFGLGMALFLLCGLCAAVGVALSFRAEPDDHRLAFRPVLVGILCFVAYYFIHPYLPRLP